MKFHPISLVPAKTEPRVSILPADPATTPLPLPSVDQVDLWVLDTDHLAPRRDHWAASLSKDEQARRDRFVRPADRLHFELFRGLLRHQLASYLEVEPAAVQFDYGPQGKPALAQPFQHAGLEFNVSHTGPVMALAVTRSHPVGVDVERLNNATEVQQLATRFFHPQESQRMANLPASTQHERFFRWWTAKEALLKAWGIGLNQESLHINFDPWTGHRLTGLRDADGISWLILPLNLAAPWMGTLACASTVSTVNIRLAAGLREQVAPLDSVRPHTSDE